MALPLTTVFNPPSQCTENTWWVGSYELLGGTGYSSCLPPSFTPTSTFYYTPGLYCPNGYTSACSSLDIGGGDTTTVVTCCPSAYTCQYAANDYPWKETLGCASRGPNSVVSHTLQVSTGTIISAYAGGGVNAYSVQIRYCSDDLVGLTSTSASSPSTSKTDNIPSSTLTADTTTTAIATPSPTTSTSPSRSGLSTGAKAGLAVGVILGVALIAAVVFLAWNIGRRSSIRGSLISRDLPELVQSQPVWDGTKASDNGVQLAEPPRYELAETQSQPHEMPAS